MNNYFATLLKGLFHKGILLKPRTKLTYMFLNDSTYMFLYSQHLSYCCALSIKSEGFIIREMLQKLMDKRIIIIISIMLLGSVIIFIRLLFVLFEHSMQ